VKQARERIDELSQVPFPPGEVEHTRGRIDEEWGIGDYDSIPPY